MPEFQYPFEHKPPERFDPKPEKIHDENHSQEIVEDKEDGPIKKAIKSFVDGIKLDRW